MVQPKVAETEESNYKHCSATWMDLELLLTEGFNAIHAYISGARSIRRIGEKNNLLVLRFIESKYELGSDTTVSYHFAFVEKVGFV